MTTRIARGRYSGLIGHADTQDVACAGSVTLACGQKRHRTARQSVHRIDANQFGASEYGSEIWRGTSVP